MNPLRCVYDLRMAPVTFDFSHFLVACECARQLLERDSFSVTILADGYRKQTERDVNTPQDEKAHRIYGILLQCTPLFPHLTELIVTTEPTCRDFEYPNQYPSGGTPYSAGQIVEFHKAGAKVSCIEAPAFAKTLVPDVDITLTLRASRHFPDRNVNTDDWQALYDHLIKEGYSVLVVPDQEDPRLGSEQDEYIPAAFDMRLRYALYQKARFNVVSSNGPASLLQFTDCPHIIFDQYRGGVFTPDMYERMNGIPAGSQLPWSRPDQTIAWVDSTADTLIDRVDKALEVVRMK